MSTARTQLLDAFKSRAFSFGDFTLASGKKSSYYVNSKRAIFNGDVVNLLSEVLWEMTKELQIDAAGGLEVGAIPMAAVLAQRYAMHGKPLEGFFVRKQQKEHGAKQRVEGVLNPGMRVVVLDDVLTIDAVDAELRMLEARARETGVAIAIGHPHEITLDAVAYWTAHQSGFQLVPLSEAIRLKTEREARRSLALAGG